MQLICLMYFVFYDLAMKLGICNLVSMYGWMYGWIDVTLLCFTLYLPKYSKDSFETFHGDWICLWGGDRRFRFKIIL